MNSIDEAGVVDQWIVGTDGSDGADVAARWTLTQASGRRTAVEIVQVCPKSNARTPSTTASITDRAPDTLRADLDAVVARFTSAGVEARARVVVGGISQTLLEASAEAALLVVGSRGRGGFNRLLLGSVSHQCAAYTRIPIVVVPHTASLDAAVQTVVVGLDGSERSLAALEWALAFAPQDARFEVVGAWTESRLGSIAMMQDLSDDLRFTHQAFHDMLDAVEPDLIGERELRRRFVHEQPKSALLDAGSGADLLVVGQRGHAGLSAAILGSVATHMLHHSPVPVAVVPHEPAAIPIGPATAVPS